MSPLTCWAQLCLSPRAQALDVLAHHDSDKLRRRALRLFTDKVRLLRGELESLADLPLRDRTAHEERLAASALLPCALLEQQAASALSPLAKQALLAAVGASAAAFGKARPDAVMAALPAVLACAGDVTAPAAVRGSALVALAATVQAVGMRLVPLLPAAMKALLAAGLAAASRLAASSPTGSTAVAATVTVANRRGNDDDDDDADAVAAAAQSAEEAAAVELAASLAALSSLIRGLGAFLSPYLREALQLVLDPAVLSCSTAGCSAAAAAVRAELPAVVPARLLLEPLFAQLPRAIERGVGSTLALLEAVAATTERMETKVAAAYHEQVNDAGGTLVSLPWILA